MAHTVYILTALTSLVCALLLARAYRASRVRLLFWSALCFAGLTVTNLLLITDLIFFRDVNLESARAAVSLGSIFLLLYGLIFKGG